MTIQYDGTRYGGWQRQLSTENTIQGKIEQILTKMVGRSVEIDGAGRTDAGVHALGQTANVHLKEEYSPEDLKVYLNRYLPEDIEITDVKRASERFHSRLNAKGKVYCYHIGLAGSKNVFQRRYRYTIDDELALDRMKEAAACFIGTHDFKSFCGNRRMKKSTIRTIYAINFRRENSELYITYEGNGFLNHMIRIMTGTLIEVGRGEREPDEMPKILSQMDRSCAGFLAPAKGLTLMEVKYE